MHIATKFNLVLISILSLAFVIASYFSYQQLQSNAQREVVDHAAMMMETALAIRDYTVKEVRPLLQTQMRHTFLPQSVPAYAATQSFNALRKQVKHAQFSYKEATLNPTNPLNRATDWEDDIIRAFRDGLETEQFMSIRETPLGPLLHLARPIQIKKESCLICHGQPDQAPKSMLARYNSRTNGFGWKLNEIVGAQIVTVPLAVPRAAANQAFIKFMITMLIIYLLVIVTLNILLNKMIIKPIIQMAEQANEISMGNMTSPEFNESGKDELSTLGASFNRMRRSLHKAIQMIEGKPRK